MQETSARSHGFCQVIGIIIVVGIDRYGRCVGLGRGGIRVSGYAPSLCGVYHSRGGYFKMVTVVWGSRGRGYTHGQRQHE